MSDKGKIYVEGDEVVIRLPMSDLHGLRVALEECPCKATKSNATRDVRQRISRALGRLTGRTKA